MPDPSVKADSFKVSIGAVESIDKDIRLTIRCANRATRALHYIADVRTTKYDPATRTLTLSLSDEGRVLIPGAVSKLPVFRHIDPGGEAEVQLRIPNRVVKLSRSAPPDKVAFDVHQLSDADEVVVNVGWSDVPYYVDARRTRKVDKALPAVKWEQFKTQATKRLKDEPPGKRAKK